MLFYWQKSGYASYCIEMKYQVKKNLGAIVSHAGVTFRVWAPFAKNVQLAERFYDETGHQMENEGDGYWSLHLPDAAAGFNYQYLIDTGEYVLRRNDPRARTLTASEGGMSVVTANDFDWGDDLFMPISHNKLVIYELHVGTFDRKDASTPGTFYDVVERLDYLEELGINMIELMPVTSMTTSNGWGYNASHAYAIEPAYGGRHGLMTLVKEAHARGIGVMLDVVYNHYITTDLWQFDGWHEGDNGGIYFYNDERGFTPWGARPDYGRPEVRQYLLDNVAMWLSEYRLDGLRLDSTIYMRNTEGRNDDPEHDIPEAWSLLGAMTELAHKINPGALMVAEDCSVNEYLTKPVREGGCGFNAQWGLNFPHGIRAMSGLSVPFPVDFYSELLSKYNNDAFQKIIFTDSHDTAANGQKRLNEEITPGNAESVEARQRTLLTSAITLTSPGIPLLLQGQEFMQEGDFSDWKELEWAKTEQFEGIVRAHTDLLRLRMNQDGKTLGLTAQNVSIFHRDDVNTVLGYHRWDSGLPGDNTAIIVNFSFRTFEGYAVTLPHPGTWHTRFNSSWKGYSPDFVEMPSTVHTTDDEGNVLVSLAPYGVLILSQEPAEEER